MLLSNLNIPQNHVCIQSLCGQHQRPGLLCDEGLVTKGLGHQFVGGVQGLRYAIAGHLLCVDDGRLPDIPGAHRIGEEADHQ